MAIDFFIIIFHGKGTTVLTAPLSTYLTIGKSS